MYVQRVLIFLSGFVINFALKKFFFINAALKAMVLFFCFSCRHGMSEHVSKLKLSKFYFNLKKFNELFFLVPFFMNPKWREINAPGFGSDVSLHDTFFGISTATLFTKTPVLI